VSGDNRRVLKVERELKELLAQIFLQDLKLPLPGFSSVAHVDVSRDLRSARIFVRFVGSEEDMATVEALLERQRTEIQRLVSRRLLAKFCPVLSFKIGGGGAVLSESDRLLASLHRTLD
jgi:ribosome-binding factor A